jgi:hypothetical protein
MFFKSPDRALNREAPFDPCLLIPEIPQEVAPLANRNGQGLFSTDAVRVAHSTLQDQILTGPNEAVF